MKWISVKEKLPEQTDENWRSDPTRVLVYSICRFCVEKKDLIKHSPYCHGIMIARYNGKEWLFESEKTEHTHYWDANLEIPTWVPLEKPVIMGYDSPGRTVVYWKPLPEPPTTE